jgi:hypothetical protein
MITPIYAQSSINLPVPGTMVMRSPAFVPVLLKGMTIHPEDPLKLDFIVNSGNAHCTSEEINKEAEKLVKYFLASMTVPSNDLWVNLSPYEKDRLIPEKLGKTDLGRDMLSQDYILKQLTASLIYPQIDLGNRFWNTIYKKARGKFGISDIPIDTFNKVWVMPETATVYEEGKTVYIINSRLKVLLHKDYLAIKRARENKDTDIKDAPDVPDEDAGSLSAQVVREIILPEIEKEINQGKNFAPLRQIYHSLILAKWYKKTIHQSLLSKLYVDQNKVEGIELNDKTVKDQIYKRYMDAYKKGVFDFIREDYDPVSQEIIPREYFSGGIKDADINIERTKNRTLVSRSQVGDVYELAIRIDMQRGGEDNALMTDIRKARIVSLINELNSRGIRPAVHGRDLRDFSNSDTLIEHIQQYTVLKGVADIRRVLEWKLNITASKRHGAKVEPPLGLSKETVDNPTEAANILYEAIFDQNNFLAHNAQKPLNIVLFRRETGGQQLTNLLKTLDNVNVKVIVSGVDDGESWRDASKAFNATGIPTAGKTLLDLSQSDSVKNFLSSRIDNKKELPALIMGLKHPSPGVNLKSENMKGIYQKGQSIVDPFDWHDKEKTRLRQLAEYLEEFYTRWRDEGGSFPLRDMPVRSMVLVGAAYLNAADGVPQWQKAIDEIGLLLNLKEGDQVILPTEERQHLIALREDGTVHFSEESLTHYNSESPIIGMWLVRGTAKRFNVDNFIEDLRKIHIVNYKTLPDDDPSLRNISQGSVGLKESIQSATRKVPAYMLRSVIYSIDEFSSTQGKNLISATRQTEDAIKNSDMIIYSSVSLEKNLAAGLIVPGIREAIKQATNAVKINLGATKKDHLPNSNKVMQRLGYLYKYLKNNRLHLKATLDENAGQYVDYVVDTYLEDDDQEMVYDELELIRRATKRAVSTVAVKAKMDGAELFSTELKEAIISLAGIKRAGFKVVDVQKNKGKLILNDFIDPGSWAKGQLGLFDEDRDIESVISKIQRNWEQIRHQGGFVFDVDKTILPKGAKSVTNYTRLAYLFMRLLREGVKVAIISGNSKEEQMSRIVDAIKVQMRDDPSALERLTFYVNGGATKIGFTVKGEEDTDNEQLQEYNQKHSMRKDVIEPAIAKAVKEFSETNFGLEGDALTQFVSTAEEKYKKLDLQTPWKGETDQKLDIAYHTPQDILDFTSAADQGAIRESIVFPWVEKRGEIVDPDGNVRYGSLAIKPIPKLKAFGIDPREEIMRLINKYLGEGEKDFNIRVGGSTTIDITGASAQKNVALEDFITATSQSARVAPQLNKKNFYYFGDEFFQNGNDEPISALLDRGNILAVNDENKDVSLKAIHIGRSPQATLEFLEAILIRPAEIGGAMGRWAYERTSFDPDTGKLTLHNATRIAKNGVVEKIFLIEGMNKPRDIVLSTRALNPDEKRVIDPIKDALGAREDLRVITRDKNAVKHRLYGLAAQNVLYLREDIISKGNPAQIEEAVDHEQRELSASDHNAIREDQYQGGLRKLITKLSNKDKADVGGIDFNEIDIERKGNGPAVYFDPPATQTIIHSDVGRVVPVLVNLKPLNSIMSILGK